MTKRDIQIRDKIIDATIGLIKKFGDTSKITMRGIAAEAGVGLAMINYHFQTKDNLINICILKIIGQSIEQFEAYSQNSDMKPIDKLRELGKGIAAFMCINPGISMISMTGDFITPKADDNTAQVSRMLLPIIKEICCGKKGDRELLILLHMLISSIEAGFLRKDIIRETIGIDFMDTEQRDDFVEFCINQIVKV
ncbi:MAG: TetR/AcrR family transcriptional regulator [Saccharofermentanales bacterium]